MMRIATTLFVLLVAIGPAVADEPNFKAGFAKRDITPTAPLPMWGYGDRHADLSQGVTDPLLAKAIVIEAGDDRIAIVGTDIGRGPTEPMMTQVRQVVRDGAGIETVLISGSHSHHGPVIELTDEKGFGKGKFDDAVAYSARLPELLIEAILEAADKLEPARMGIAKHDVDLNRNRHTKKTPKPTDPMLAVVRFDAVDGRPLAILVNFAAHPTSIPSKVLKYSPDYPGHLENRVESAMETNCVFMQGASGDMSTDRRGLDVKAYGEKLGDHVVALAQSMETAVPKKPSIKAQVDRFNFPSRVDFNNRLLVATYGRAFFPELVNNFAREFRDGIRAEMTTVLLNGDTALVTGSGEFFCNHSNRLKERSYVPHTLFFGYCNGHHMYFPTIEAASEGGYGGDPTVAPVAVGAGEEMMNRALVNIYRMLGKFPPAKAE